MRRFKSAGHTQRFLSAFGIITSHFRVGRHLYKASVSEATARTHVDSIVGKLSASGRTEAVVFAAQRGFLEITSRMAKVRNNWILRKLEYVATFHRITWIALATRVNPMLNGLCALCECGLQTCVT